MHFNTEDQTINFEYCACDADNKCNDAILTSFNQMIKVCLFASPSNVEIIVTYVNVDTLEVQRNHKDNTVVLAGELLQEFFNGASQDVYSIVGKVDLINTNYQTKVGEAGIVVPVTFVSLVVPGTSSSSPTEVSYASADLACVLHVHISAHSYIISYLVFRVHRPNHQRQHLPHSQLN